MTHGMTTSPRSSRRPPNLRFRSSAHGTPMRSLMISVPNVYLKVFFSASRKFGSCRTPFPFALTSVPAGTRMSTPAPSFERRAVGERSEGDGLVAGCATTGSPLPGPARSASRGPRRSCPPRTSRRPPSASRRAGSSAADGHRGRGSALPRAPSHLRRPRTFANRLAPPRFGKRREDEVVGEDLVVLDLRVVVAPDEVHFWLPACASVKLM